ncbi:GFA family protein [Gloeocapsa sp. PCC 73106]|uniref:GFA family protein n=1 Tax=Gloeocapsa sp. PCC 73106 TaxID=102232 RepID=UPI0002ABE479|nr:GFA family protein [Gloeocapsa sp. PCC 73106]ELR99842.1 hypothetical protein GLO73106DRAFT_00036940 [Gloeocapsa sp. PCC 73106]
MTGTCLCGGIEFEVEAIPGMVFNCHCTRCQKSHGAAFATQAFAIRKTLIFKKGQELLQEYESTGGIRAFCRNCGSRLMNYALYGGEYLSVAVTCLAESNQIQPVAHCFTDNKLTWHNLSDQLPRYPGLPDNL